MNEASFAIWPYISYSYGLNENALNRAISDFYPIDLK